MKRSLTKLAKTLAAAGIDRGIIALATGKAPHAIFAYRCEAVADPKADVGDSAPPGPPFTTLWECGDTITGYWKRARKIEFVEFDIEAPKEQVVIGHSAQALLGWTFFWLVEDEDWDDREATLARLREAAQAVGFAHLDDVLRVQREHGRDRHARDKYLAFVRSL
jgi:hypothetical protein